MVEVDRRRAISEGQRCRRPTTGEELRLRPVEGRYINWWDQLDRCALAGSGQRLRAERCPGRRLGTFQDLFLQGHPASGGTLRPHGEDADRQLLEPVSAGDDLVVVQAFDEWPKASHDNCVQVEP